MTAAGWFHLGRQGWHRHNDHVQHPPVDVGACRVGLLDGLDQGFAALAGDDEALDVEDVTLVPCPGTGIGHAVQTA